MSKPLIVIADMDTAYLAELENKFLVELGDRAELEIISDPEYFEQFFSNPVTAEIVAVNENLYTNALQRQDIQNLFILSEHQEQGRTEELSVSRVYKYYGIKELYNELTYKLSLIHIYTGFRKDYKQYLGIRESVEYFCQPDRL